MQNFVIKLCIVHRILLKKQNDISQNLFILQENTTCFVLSTVKQSENHTISALEHILF